LLLNSLVAVQTTQLPVMGKISNLKSQFSYFEISSLLKANLISSTTMPRLILISIKIAQNTEVDIY